MIPPDQSQVYPGFEYKSHIGAVDDIKPEGLVTAVAAVYGQADDPLLGNDIIHDGSFDETLVERKARIGHIYNHNWGAVLGSHKEIWSEKGVGLMAKSQHNLETFWGNEIFQLIKAGDISGYSFQFLVRRGTPEKKSFEMIDGKRHLYGLHLFELGPAPQSIAVNPGAVVTEAKAGLYGDVPFVDMLSQAELVLSQLVEAGEALAIRREEVGRKAMTPDKIEAIMASAAKLEGSLGALKALAVVPDDVSREAEQKSRSLHIRTEMARARARSLGINVE